MPSATCTVNNISSLSSVDVTPQSTVTVKLADPTGASNWTLSCVSTDDGNSSATINNTLSINSLTKTATFTSPALGSMVFQSVVNGGRDVNGAVQANLTYSFMVCVPDNGFRYIAANETVERDKINGWTKPVNDLIRAVADITGTINGGGSSDRNASFLVMALTASLNNERVLSAGSGLKLADGGGGGAATFSVDPNVVAFVSGSTFQKLSGSLQRTAANLSYLVAGPNVTITSQSNGQVIVGVTGTGAAGAAGGDLAGTYPNPTVAKINGVTVTGTPSAGQVPTATSSTAASWQNAGILGFTSDGFKITNSTVQIVETSLQKTVITSSNAEVMTTLTATPTTIFTASVIPNALCVVNGKVQGLSTQNNAGIFDFTTSYIVSGSTPTLLGTTTTPVQGTVTAKNSWDVASSIVGNQIAVNVKGDAGNTITWSGVFKITNTYAGVINAPTSSAVTGSGTGVYATGVAYRGINRAGPEYFADWDGWTGQTYYEFPNVTVSGGGVGSVAKWASELTYLTNKGFNCIRIPIAWERVQHTLLGPLDTSYLANLQAMVKQATDAGFTVLIDLHNYSRYAVGAFNAAGTQVGTYTQQVLSDGVLSFTHLNDVWTKLANVFKSNSQVIFELMNESHDTVNLTSTQLFAGCQGVINAIRATGATNEILALNSRGSDTDHWYQYSPIGGPLDAVAALALTDSANNLSYAVHAYWGGAPARYASYTALLKEVGDWAATNGKRLWLTEFGYSAPDQATYETQVGGALTYMNASGSVWRGWTPWNLPNHQITNAAYTADGPPMATFTPFLVPNTVQTGASGSSPPTPPATGSIYHIVSNAGVSTNTWYVNQIVDQNGGGNNITCNDSANAVQLLTTQFKGGTLPSIYFPDWNNQSSASFGSTLTFSNSFSTFMTFKTSATASSPADPKNPGQTFFGKTTSQVASFGLTAGNVVYKHNGTTAASTGLSLNNGNPHTIAIAHAGNGSCVIWADGTQVYSGTITYATAAFDRMGVGQFSHDPARDLNVAEVYFFNRGISAAEVATFHSTAVSTWF